MSNGYLSQYAACRDIGHAWDYFEWSNGKRTLICSNCDTRRTDRLDSHSITSRTYAYPKAYLWKGVTPVPIQELRKQLKREADKLMRWVGTRPHLTVVKKRSV